MAGDERSRVEDTRRRNRAGWSAGAAAGATAGLLWGLVSSWIGALAALVIGGIAGAVVGRWIAAHVAVEEWDPASAHPYVGMHAPDVDNLGLGR